MNYKCLIAKSDKDSENSWLPLWMHLRDTAGIMQKLVRKWIPRSTVNATRLDAESFEQTAIFLAAIHDIGKATSYFQAIISQRIPHKFDDINNSGYELHDSHQYLYAGKTHHPYAGEWILRDYLKVNVGIAEIVGAHHGKPLYDSVNLIEQYPKNFYGTETDNPIKNTWEEVWNTFYKQAFDLQGLNSAKQLPNVDTSAKVLLSGLLIVADWIASNTTYFPLIDIDDCGEDEQYPERIEIAWEKIDLPEEWYSGTYRMDAELFDNRFGFIPNSIQNSVLDVVNNYINPGIFILESQMGSGKTEAALASAEVLASKTQAGGIFFGLPTQTTSNGLFPRLLDWANSVSVDAVQAIRLAHGAATYNDEYNELKFQGKSFVDDVEEGSELAGVEVHPWFQGNKKALLADFVLGTVDQFLLATLKRKHYMLRHIGLAGKVVIIDEVHAYDAYMNQYLEQSIRWMAAYGVPVILLSATIPKERRTALVQSYVQSYIKNYCGEKKAKPIDENQNWKHSEAYPLLTWSDGKTIHQKRIEQQVDEQAVHISYIDSVNELIKLLEEKLEGGGCACVVVNTVKCAQEIYQRINEAMTNVHTCLYHAQFTMPDRANKEQELLKHMGKKSTSIERDKYILVGTQVLEQSLDYDADILVTQLCPMDLLLQRIGRLHRHSDRKRPNAMKNPQCIVLRDENLPYDAGTKAVYGDYLLKRTQDIMPEKISIPEDIAPLVQSVYSDNYEYETNDTSYIKAKEEFDIRLKTKKENAKNYLLGKPSISFHSSLLNSEVSGEKVAEASVRDGDSTIEVILVKAGDDKKILFLNEADNKIIHSLSADITPDNREGRLIAKQRLHLPHVLCRSWNIGKTIEELEDINRKNLPQWQLSAWLKGELILLLDENNTAELNGYKLVYSTETGLQYIKIEERKNDGKEI